jgi:hypothetical protein
MAGWIQINKNKQKIRKLSSVLFCDFFQSLLFAPILSHFLYSTQPFTDLLHCFTLIQTMRYSSTLLCESTPVLPRHGAM